MREMSIKNSYKTRHGTRKRHFPIKQIQASYQTSQLKTFVYFIQTISIVQIHQTI